MNIWGFLFMAVTWGLILSLLVFTFSRIFKNRKGKQ
jgi:hypothetical protein